MKLDLSRILYSPILKGKMGEYNGAHDVDENLKQYILPVVVPPTSNEFDHELGRALVPAEHVKLFGPRLMKSWGKRPVFVDAINMDNDANKGGLPDHPLTALIQRSRSSGALTLPLTGIRRSEEYQIATKRSFEIDRFGIGLRLTVDDLESERFEDALSHVLEFLAVRPEQICVFIDLGYRTFAEPQSLASVLIERINHLPLLHHWKSVALACSEFPKLIKMPTNDRRDLRRGEWSVFESILARSEELFRIPTFSDYVVEHPIHNAVKKRAGRISFNVHLRYTGPDAWHVFRGEKFESCGLEGIYAVAKRIAESDVYSGPNFSVGDRMIDQWSRGEIKPGTPSTWRQASVSRHMTLVSKSIATKLGHTLVQAPALQPTEPRQRELFDL